MEKKHILFVQQWTFMEKNGHMEKREMQTSHETL